MPISDRELAKKYNKEWRTKRKMAVLDFLGNKCVRCGFTDSRALQIDHINGGGNSEYGETGGGRFQSYLYKLRFVNPDKMTSKYQILCANCNWIKRAEKDENTHQGSGEKQPRPKARFEGLIDLRKIKVPTIVVKTTPNS